MWKRVETSLLGAPAQLLPAVVRNEIYKLRAGAADRLSTACFSLGAVGLLSPLFVGIVQPDAGFENHPLDWLGIVQIGFGVVFWTGLGFMLHMIGEVFLTRMEAK